MELIRPNWEGPPIVLDPFAAIHEDNPQLPPGRTQAVIRLAFARKQHPDLNRALAEANLELAQAILQWDEAEERRSDGEPIHTLNEQAAVNQAMQQHAQALANLLRGHEATTQP